MFQEQRIILCTALPLSNGLVIGCGGSPTTPQGFQDIGNPGFPSIRVYDSLGVEFVWAGNPVGYVQCQGNITGAALAMTTLSQAGAGSQGEYGPQDSDPQFQQDADGNETIMSPPPIMTPNLAVMQGAPGGFHMTFDLTKLRINFFQLLAMLNGGAGTLTCTLSLRYQT